MNRTDGPGLGKFGIYTFDFERQPATLMRESVAALDEQGWRALWFPEVGGREALSQAAFLLASTERMQIINGIAQISARGPQQAYGGSVLLADAYPGRHVLGLGVGRSRPGVKPVTAMAGYLDELDALQSSGPAVARVPMRRILAAYGPRMLELARDRPAGAHTYHVTVPHPAQAREILGRDPSVYLDPGSTYNLAKFRRMGYSEADISHGGSDRLVDDLVLWGGPDSIADRLRAHLEAGADHVAVQVIGTEPGQTAMPYWRQLGDMLLH
jgi:alkanesulfonate monooxygenase SsuD/methylene tetrahydromethanopterin reductase-like flavin-dependent oxidoreductase (luciferase family)